MVSGRLHRQGEREVYRIDGLEDMPPFLTTVVSDTDLWMFVTSTGVPTAGRVDADHALFPYMTDDRMHDHVGVVGPASVVARTVEGSRQLWRPFGRAVDSGCTRAVAKSTLGDLLIFEERNTDWGLLWRATWSPSHEHGWVRTVELVDVAVDVGDGSEHDNGVLAGRDVEVLDALLDVNPAGVDVHTEQVRSNLVDAYKRSETGPWGTVAVFSLESLVSDRAEPMEALTATTIWSWGLDGATIDLDDRAVDAMVAGEDRAPMTLVTGRAGAYVRRGRVTVPAGGSVRWGMVADTPLGQADVLDVVDRAAEPDAAEQVAAGVAAGTERLHGLLSGADAFQSTADPVADAHHLSNVLFNSMRGGVFPFEHRVPTDAFAEHVAARNVDVANRHADWLASLDVDVHVDELRTVALETGDPDLVRVVLGYLPLTFSRRHGDPSRPWNRFSINVRDDDGAQVLAWEGNWRDIFQNWEALLQSYPAYFPNVVATFLNASTIDGFNPYRVSQDGIDWEVPDPDDPWSHIGYWGDHQIVYLLRLLESWEAHDPHAIVAWLAQRVFTFADVPYRLDDHEAMVDDPRDTITFDESQDRAIEDRVAAVGADGRLRIGPDGELLRASMLEKLLVPALAKLASLVPGGGLWLNTQRPEWNDANNALAGPGLSMVTLFHLRRYLAFLDDLLDGTGSGGTGSGGDEGHAGRPDDDETWQVSSTVATWLRQVTDGLADLVDRGQDLDDHARRTVLDALATSAEAHRARVAEGRGHDLVAITTADVRGWCDVAVRALDATIATSMREDGLYHSYNRVSFGDGTARVDHLGPMLEGQVAALSSGTLDGAAVVALVDALYESDLHRADLDTFMLYPATSLPSFLDRNDVPDDAAQRLRAAVSSDGLSSLFDSDDRGGLHFRPGLVNAKVLWAAMDDTDLDAEARAVVEEVYEQVFDHASFTGRSGSMYGYEGLGSVYWHMVAKLVVAVQEAWWAALDDDESAEVADALAGAYRRTRSGLGFCSSPEEFGAFPIDCYSHTPAHAGAQQPGMTGQVKEEVLTRLAELGVRVRDGQVHLRPGLLAPGDVLGDEGSGTATFTLCGVTMTVRGGDDDGVEITRVDGVPIAVDGLSLDGEHAQELFARAGAIDRVAWTVGPATMRRWAEST